MDVRWYYNRLKLMSFNEVLFFRVPQFFQLNVIGHLQTKKQLQPLLISKQLHFHRYSLKTIKALFDKNPFDEEFRFFNTKINVLKVSNWRKDYHNKIVSPLNYYGKINRQDYNVNGDIKFLAEISRLQFMPFLAFKSVESNRPEYLNRIEIVLQDWQKQNPYLNSIHWTSGIEVAIRSVNLVFTYQILHSFNKLSNKTDIEIRKQMAYNYQFLKNHLSLYSSANNHLMAELMGLNVIGAYFKVSKKETSKWKKMFFAEVQKQVNEDGVHMELCTRYHAEVLDQIIITLQFLKYSKTEIPYEINSKLKEMFKFIEHVSYCNVDTVFGDNDEGFVIDPYFVRGFSLYGSQLASSNHLFKTRYKSSGDIDFRNYMIFGEKFSNTVFESLPQNTYFKHSGYCFMYDHNAKIKLSFDVGCIGDNLSAAHGHSDIFHINLQQGSHQILVDPGTYQYHKKEVFWRDYFRGITAHNTISVNNQNHAVANNRMSWANRPEAPKTEIFYVENEVTCKSEHRAFRDVVHQRTINFSPLTKKITITDTLINYSSKSSNIEFYLQFHPKAQLKLNKNNLILKGQNKVIILKNTFFNKAKIIEGCEELPLAWYSEKYNTKLKSKCLKLTNELNKKTTLETIVSYE